MLKTAKPFHSTTLVTESEGGNNNLSLPEQEKEPQLFSL